DELCVMRRVSWRDGLDITQYFNRIRGFLQVITKASTDKWTSMQLAILGNLFGREPQCTVNVRVERFIRIVAQQLTSEAKANESLGRVLLSPAIDADQSLRLKVPSGFFAYFSYYRLKQRFGVFQMPCGLVEGGAAVDSFLDHEKPAVLLDDSSDRNASLQG